VIRAPKGQLANGIEINWNSDGGEELISQLRAELPACTIGTGTLLTLDHLEQAIAGALLFTPTLIQQ